MRRRAEKTQNRRPAKRAATKKKLQANALMELTPEGEARKSPEILARRPKTTASTANL